ncbi:MAG: hypothetical protein KGM99_15745, partial [Burkholderiales bacterium]|nr:hypothetical protein [Burkholderiales bacterium]
KRLGLLQNSRQLFKATIHGRRFSAATGLPIRYIDRVLVAYGQEETIKIGVSRGICLEKTPRCGECPIKNEYCKFNL